MKVHIINIGCKVNFADASRLKELLLNNNYDIADNIENADIILINTCSVTNHSELESRQIIRKAKKNNPNAFVGVLGCYAQLNPAEIIEKTNADAVFGINEKFQIPQLLNNYFNKNQNIFVSNINNSNFEISFSAENENRTRAFLKLQDGCNFNCSYCTIPLARGNSRSVIFNDIPKYINKLASKYKEIVITGINLSDYKSNDKNFHDIIKLINDLYNEYPYTRFRISSIEPQIINEQLINIIANSKNICPHFHIPLQSGNDKQLKDMKRRYNIKQFKDKIEIINNYIPLAFIGLDLICGFPNETDDDFMQTKQFINELNISQLHTFTYSMRRNTIAATMSNQIPLTIKKQRTNEIIQISKIKYQKFINKNINQIKTFLPENELDNLTYTGYTENYIRTIVNTNQKLKKQFYKIKIVSAKEAYLLE